MGKKIQYIGRYVMDAITLGKGNFARVELATHGVTQIKVAIKVIDTRKIKEDYVRQNLHREARIMAQLRHPNIIRLYETLKATTLYCLVTEFAAGGELLTYIKSQESSRLTEAQARNYIRQLISAIYYLHERSVVHRDLKMENIMLDESKNNIKLIDFGLSNVYREDDPLKTHCGSPEYAAPELFIVGRTYGPEIDIWSLGIITYAMVLGKLPFFAPFKDEYMKQRLLQSIQKGLSSYHDREMHAGGLSQECRHMLHQIIEPNPEARIQMSEVIIHPWVTRNGKYPFCPYVNPPKDTNMRRQVVGELAFMMNLKRRNVEDTVKETRADELSSMFNMMMDQKRRTGGLFDIDHTFRKCARRDRDSRSRSRERDKVKTPDSGRAKLVNPKGGQKKVPNKCKAGVNGKAKPKNKHYASGTRPPDKTTLQFSATDTLIGEHTRVVIHHEPGVRKPVEVCHTPRRPKTSYLGVPAVIVGGEDKPHPSTANGPTKIPLSQRRVPPAKLNLTLDLSVTNRLPSSKPPISVSGNAGATETGGGRQGPSVGIAASSGVPPRLSTPNKSLPSKIPVLSPTSKEKSTASAQTPKASNRPSNLCAGLKSRTETGCCSAEGASRLCQTKENMIAPKATPEDSAIDSYSTSSEEPSPVEAISTGVVPGTSQAQCEATMQHEMLKASADEKGRQARLQCQTSCTNSSSGDVSSNNPTETHTEDTSSSCTLEKKPLDVRCKTSRHKLVKNLSESEQYTGTASASPTSRSTPSGYQLALLTASGSSLPTRIHDNCFTCADSVELPMSSSCLVTGTGSERRFSATGKTVSESRITAVSAGVQQSNVNPAFKLFLSNPAKLNTPKDCGMCGLSPGSPSYDQKHSKFCHTGAHALDVFVSPDEVPSSSDALWRPTVSTYRGSPLPHSSPVFQFPRVAHTPGFPMQSSGALVDTFTDSEFEDDEEHATKSGTAFTYSTPVQCHELCHIHRRRPLLGSTGRSLSDNTESRQVRLAHQNRTSLLNSELHTRPHDTTLNFESGEGCPEIKQLEPLETTTEPVGGVLQHQQDDSRLDQSDAPCDKVNQQPEQEVSPPCKSRIPRPATKSGKMHVFRLLSSEKKDKEDIIGDERQPKRSHSLPKKSERNKFLKHSDGRSRQLSWRRGLSQLLRMTRPSPNSNNNISVIKTKQSNGTTRNSVTPGNKAGARPTDNTIKEKDPKWNTKHPLTHKCNSPEVTSSPVPSSPPPNVPDQYDVNTGSDQHADVSESSHKSKSKKVSLSGCKECAKSDQSSDEEKEDRTEELELSMSGAMKATLVPAANSLKPLSKMTSKV